MAERTAPLYGAIEAGGTKFECVVAHGCDAILASERINTDTPDHTLDEVVRFFATSQARCGPVSAFGVASFGPLNLDPRSADFGHMLATPKPGWSRYDMTQRLRQHFGQPVYIDTDVNAAALAEWLEVSSRVRSLAYVTVGTGIGGGAVLDGRVRHGLWHPEMGHIRVRRHPQDLSFMGVCPFHGDCLEGLASGPAIVARWGRPLHALDRDPLARGIIGSYLGQLAVALTLLLAPECIVFGGGVMSGGDLLPYVRDCVRGQLAGYVTHELLQGTLEDFIVRPALGERSGICGAILLASAAAASR